MLLDDGLATESRSAKNGRVEVRLVPTERAHHFLLANDALLHKPLVKWATQRFGGQVSHELSELAVRWAKDTLGATFCEPEASDNFSGKWDLLCDTPAGKVIIEIESGEAKAHAAIHACKARTAGLPIIFFCKNAVIQERVRKYLRENNIMEDGKNVRVLAAEEKT